MIPDMKWFIIREFLVPNPSFEGNYKDDSFVWTDKRPYPSEAEITRAEIEFKEQEAKEFGMKAAKKAYIDALNAGYTIDGITYYCDEQAAMEFCMVTVLNILEEDEPVYIMTKSHGIQSTSLANFRDLANQIGRHTYSLRQEYWAEVAALR